MTLTLIKPNAGGEYEWYAAASASPGHGDLEQLAALETGAGLLYVMPMEDLVWRRLTIAPAERRMYRKTLPYTLEDELIDDVDTLHFAFSTPQDNQVDVVALRVDRIQAVLTEFASAGLSLQHLVPECLLLPVTEESWTLLVDGNRCLVRTSDHRALAVDRHNLGLALQALLDQSEQLPRQLKLFTPASEREAVDNVLPELLRGVVSWTDADYWQVIQPQAQQPLVDCLQGEFARGLPLKKWWQAWRPVAVFAAVVVALQFGLAVTQYNLLKQENQRLTAAIEGVYRQVEPRGVMIDAEEQLQRKLGALQGGDSPGFVSMLEKTALVLSEVSEFDIKSINYSDSQSEMRLTLLVPTFKDVDTIRTRLEQRGLTAQMTGTSNEGGKTRAGLRIRG